MRQKLFLIICSLLATVFFLEILLRILNYPPQLKKEFQRKDIKWVSEQVVLNSFGYRDKEFAKEKDPKIFRIFGVGDSYTFGWLIDDPNENFPKLIEKKLNNKYDKKVEVINGSTPGFTIKEMADRFIQEGKFFYPDLVIVGINDDEVNVSGTYFPPEDQTFPKLIKDLHIYQASLGNYFGKEAEKKNHKNILDIYQEGNSKDWHDFSDYILKLKKETEKINAKLAIVLFPHIHANNPNKTYDFYPYNQRFKNFGKENGILIIDPLDKFLRYPQKDKLVVNILDPHPTIEMNNLVSDEIIRQFDFENFIKDYKAFMPTRRSVIINNLNKSIDIFNEIDNISSNKNGYPWIYFETKNKHNLQNFSLKGVEFRQSKSKIDYLFSGKSFTHSHFPGATMTYHIIPTEKGKIKFKEFLYGYQVIGLSYILALRTLEDGTTKGEYITPTRVKKINEEWVVEFNQQEDYQFFELNLKAAVRQIDITENGEIENIVSTKQLVQPILEDTDKIIFSVDSNIFSSSSLRFDDFVSKGFDYVYIDGEMIKAKNIIFKDKEKEIIVELLSKVSKGKEVTLFVSTKYDLALDEQLYIDYK